MRNFSRRLGLTVLTGIGLLAGSLMAQSLDDFQRQVLTLTEQRQLLEALEVVEEGLRRFPDALELRLQQGALLLKLGRVEEGRKALDVALSLSPGDGRVISKTAESEMRRGRLDRAIELFRRALATGDADDSSQYHLAYTLFLKGSDKEALEAAEAAVSAAPLQPRFRLFLALLLNLQGRAEEAHRELVSAYRLDPDDPAILYRLSRSHQTRGNLGQALELAELAQRLDPENPLYHRRLSELFAAAGEAELSRDWEERAVRLERAFLIYARALRLTRQDRVREATLLLEEVTGKNPEFVSGWTLLAQLYQKRGLEQEALNAYLAALRHNPEQLQAREEGAFIHLRQGSLELAVELLRTSDDRSLHPGLLQGYRLMREQRWGEALELFSQLREENPLSVELIRLMSFCASELGLQGEARELLQTALSLRPQDTHLAELDLRLQFEQALNAIHRGDWAKAARGLEELVRQDAQNSDYRLHLAYSLQQAGELSRAVEEYRAGLAYAPGRHWARRNLAASLYRLQRYQEAAVEWAALAKRESTPEVLLQLGLCYSHMGRDAEAEAVFAEAVQKSPTPELIYNLGVTRLRLFKVEDAWKLLREAARQGYLPAVELVRQGLQGSRNPG